MADSAKILALDNHACNGDWTVVLPRCGKKRRTIRESRTSEEQQQLWVPTDLEFDHARQSKLIEKIQICMKRVENSQFYQNLLEQMQTPEILDRFRQVLGSEMALAALNHMKPLEFSLVLQSC